MTGRRFERSARYKLAPGIAVQFHMDGDRIEAVWDPDVPTGEQRDAIMQAYIVAREGWLLSLGRPVLVIDPGMIRQLEALRQFVDMHNG